jgi:ribosome biogenesis protein UTP30
VKDPEADFRKQIEDMDIPCIAEVIGFDRLKRDFRQFKDKRQLLKDYDVFLADIRIYKMLPEMMGKEFYSKKAFPCPIKVHGFDSPKGLKEQLNKASECAYYTMGNGPNYSVRVGMVSQDSKDIAKNMEAALGQAVGYTTCWDGIAFSQVSQVGLRISSHPIDLPVYNNLEQSDIDAYMKSS